MMNLLRQKSALIVFLAALTLLLSGCASTTYWSWEHPLHDQSLLAGIQQECRLLAREEADRNEFFYGYRSSPYYWPYFSKRHYYDPYWNWYYHDRVLRYHDDIDRNYRLCMKAKGWALVKKQKEEKQDYTE